MMNQARPAQNNSVPFRYRLWSMALIITLILTGCLGSTAPSERFFRLSDPIPPKRYIRRLFPDILTVEMFQARGMLARERTLLYRDLVRSNETQFHAVNLWEDHPAAMIQSNIFHCLDQSGLFEVVTGANHYLRPRYSLAGIVENLEQHATNGQFSALLRVHLTLTDGKAEKIILSEIYQATEPAMDGRMEVLLPAFDRAMTQVCAMLISDLETRAK